MCLLELIYWNFYKRVNVNISSVQIMEHNKKKIIYFLT